MNEHTFLLRQLDINKSGWGQCLVELENIKQELGQEITSKNNLQEELDLLKRSLCVTCKHTAGLE